MARRVIDKAFVDTLTDAFASHPGNASAASRLAGCDHRTARRGWAVGWPKQGYRPISEVIQEQQNAARALLVSQAADTRQAGKDAAQSLATSAQLDAAKERAQEGQVARMARGNALAILGTAANLAKRGYIISQNLSEKDLQALPIKERVRVLKVIAEFNREAVNIADTAIKLERLIMGQPDSIVRHEHAHVVVDATDMEATIERANAALRRSKARNIIDVTAVTVDKP